MSTKSQTRLAGSPSIVVANVVVDILYCLLDGRVRFS
jgi:ABC-type dipeptide/oligopeptide/nickel transport system permease component